ncbi:DNA-binding domain-containing protein [Roseibium sp. HPY-6]|uniref:HvfC/BufC N-terminal domain-containing protein n=1 Tax=Roseibium sp. HPY-6 TaxID=3229852 RepID=UPI00338E5B32
MADFPPKVSTADFGAALWNPDSETPEGLIGPDGITAPKRFSVYRNNVIVSLCDALAQTFPAVLNLLGEDYFRALARAFVSEHPPRTPVLMWYGDKFAEFIEAFPPLQAYPYVSDVARLEWAWVSAYHAADASPLDPAAIGAVSPDEVGQVRFKKHPASAVLMSRWPVWDLVRINRFDPSAKIEIDLQEPQSVLITRPEFEVELLLLRPGGGVFVNALLDGATLGDAAAAASGRVPEFSLSDVLSDCLANGVFSDLVTA